MGSSHYGAEVNLRSRRLPLGSAGSSSYSSDQAEGKSPVLKAGKSTIFTTRDGTNIR
jgi:hypothetical protein